MSAEFKHNITEQTKGRIDGAQTACTETVTRIDLHIFRMAYYALFKRFGYKHSYTPFVVKGTQNS